MRQGRSRSEPDISVVVPVVERHGDLAQLHAEFAAELARLGKTYEFLFVVDDQMREVVPALRALQERARGGRSSSFSAARSAPRRR